MCFCFAIFILFYMTGLYILKAAIFNQHVMIKYKVMKEGISHFWVILLWNIVVLNNVNVLHLFCSFWTYYGTIVEKFNVKKICLPGFSLLGLWGESSHELKIYSSRHQEKFCLSKESPHQILFPPNKGLFSH